MKLSGFYRQAYAAFENAAKRPVRLKKSHTDIKWYNQCMILPGIFFEEMDSYSGKVNKY